MVSVGFALWIENELAWAEGRHEYRPMGAAVIAATDVFRPRDFHPLRRVPGNQGSYAGIFASLGEMNGYLEQMRAYSGRISSRTGSKARRRF